MNAKEVLSLLDDAETGTDIQSVLDLLDDVTAS
jgi:hypothetical protein